MWDYAIQTTQFRTIMIRKKFVNRGKYQFEEYITQIIHSIKLSKLVVVWRINQKSHRTINMVYRTINMVYIPERFQCGVYVYQLTMLYLRFPSHTVSSNTNKSSSTSTPLQKFGNTCNICINLQILVYFPVL